MGADKAGDPGDHDLGYLLTSSRLPVIPRRYTLQHAGGLLQDGPPSRQRPSPPSLVGTGVRREVGWPCLPRECALRVLPLALGTLGRQTIRYSERGTPSAAIREPPLFPLPYRVPERTKGRQSPGQRTSSPAPTGASITARLSLTTVGPRGADGVLSGAVTGTISAEPGSSSSSLPWCTPEGPSPKRPLALKAPHEGLGVLKELAHGGAKGGHRLTVGVGNPLFWGGAEGVLREGVDPL